MDNFIQEHLPFWDALSKQDQALVLERTSIRELHPDRVLQLSGSGCIGVKLVRTGQVRVFITSGEGEEINLYRLLPGDICMLSVLCMDEHLHLDVNVQAEKDSKVYVIPAALYHQLSDRNQAVRDFTQTTMRDRMSDIMSMIGKVTFCSVSRRLADMLIYHSALNQSAEIPITHETLAKDIGTAREVVTRTLKQFQNAGLVSLSRGKVTLLDLPGLEALP